MQTFRPVVSVLSKLSLLLLSLTLFSASANAQRCFIPAIKKLDLVATVVSPQGKIQRIGIPRKNLKFIFDDFDNTWFASAEVDVTRLLRMPKFRSGIANIKVTSRNVLDRNRPIRMGYFTTEFFNLFTEGQGKRGQRVRLSLRTDKSDRRKIESFFFTVDIGKRCR